MYRFITHCLSIIIIVALLFCPAARCEVQFGESGKNSPQINIKKTADGLVVNVSHNQEVLEDIQFGCDQENNRIIVDLPVENDRGIMKTLQENPNVVRNGVSSESLPQQEMKRIRIMPRLKLSCTGVKMISKFQRYITYLYPAGRDLKLTATHVTGFDFDGDNPRTQVNGSIRLTFNEPLGDVDLADAVSVTDTAVTLKLNPRDFANQEMVSSLFPASNLNVRSSSSGSSGLHAFDFRGIGDADIGKVRAKLVRSPDSNELRLDVTLTVSLYATGRKLYESGNSRKALIYLEAAKRDPAFAQVARMSMGTVFWNEDNYAEAVKNFRELIELDRSWEFPEARYYALKSYYLLNKTLSFELTALLKEYLRRCDRMKYQTCTDARELSEQVNEPALKVYQASKVELKKLVTKLADPRFNYNEVQKNIFHYWATWCPVCLEEMPRIMQYAVAHPNVSIYIVAKYDSQKNILSTLLKSGAIRRKNIFYYIDTRDDIMLRQMVPLVLANKEPVTPLPISVFLQRDVPFYLTDKLNWNEAELSPIWQLKYRE